jgi:hypothetical protein
VHANRILSWQRNAERDLSLDDLGRVPVNLRRCPVRPDADRLLRWNCLAPVKLRVEAVPIRASGCLKSAALGITTKKKALLAREFSGFQYSAIFQKDARACRDVTARFDDTIVTQ